jgi:hypothetical protein
MKRLILLLLFAAVPLSSFAQAIRPTLSTSSRRMDSRLMSPRRSGKKKRVPIDVVTDPSRAIFKLKAAPVEIKTGINRGQNRSLHVRFIASGSKIRETLSVQLIEASSQAKCFGPTLLNKQRGGSQEPASPWQKLLPKHLKEFLSSAQARYSGCD